jgi:hypothetical protein
LAQDSRNCHHSRTSVVEFSILLADLLSRFPFPVVDLSEPDTIVTIQLGGRPPGKLNKSTCKDDLGKSSSRELEKSANTRVDITELQASRWGKVSIESPHVVMDESTEHGHHGDASVLALDSTVPGEGSIVSDVTKGIKESEGSGGSNLLLRNLELSARSRSVGWHKGSGSAGKKSKDG